MGGRDSLAAGTNPGRTSERLASACGILAALVAVLLYLPAVRSFFANDDWVLIDFFGRVSPWRPWEYFSPEVLWFYRPTQSLHFGLFFNWFGLNPVPYNLSLFAIHFAVCLLGFRLVRGISANPWLAAGTIALFGTTWIYADILFWKSNFNTVHWALVTLAACIAFDRHLRTGKRGWLAATWALVFANFLTKESSVNLPLLLTLVWAHHRLALQDLRPGRRLETALRAARPLLPAYLMVLAYVLWHRLSVVDVTDGPKPSYEFVSPLKALLQAAVCYNHTLVSVYQDKVLLTHLPWLKSAVFQFVSYFPAIPLLLVLLAWKLRDRVLLFGTAWILCSAFPTLLLATFHSSRFYYLPALGAALVQARIVQLAWQGSRGRHALLYRAARLAIPVLIAYLLVVNVSMIQLLVDRDAAESRRIEQVWNLLKDKRGQLERGTLIVLRNAPRTFFNNGLGLREMVRYALEDPSAEGVVYGENMKPERVNQLKALPNAYLVDLAREPLALQRLRP